MPLLLSTAYLPLKLPFCRSRTYPHTNLHQTCFNRCHLNSLNHSPSPKCPPKSLYSIRNRHLNIRAKDPAKEGAVSVMSFEDLAEKDWSFLEVDDDVTTKEQHNQTLDKIISAGEIEETSRVLISIGSHAFVDRVVESFSFQQLLVVHESLLTLAFIKEKYDAVKCWQGELCNLPEKWSPFDAVYLYYLPALRVELNQVLETLAKHCSPGARVVISHTQGREKAEEQQKEYPDIVISKLPEKTNLKTVAANHLFTIVRFVDEPGFYLAVLKFKQNGG